MFDKQIVLIFFKIKFLIESNIIKYLLNLNVVVVKIILTDYVDL